MASPATTLTVSIEPWKVAKNRFLDSLPADEDKSLFEHASLENLFHISSAGLKHSEATSKLAAARRKLVPLLESLDEYGKAVDVYAQTSAMILCPLWGSLRIVLQLALSYGKYYDKILDMYVQIGDLLPQFRAYERLFPTHPQLLAYLADAYLEIVQFSYDASRVFALPQGTTQKVFQASIKTRFKPLKDRLEKCTDCLRRYRKNILDEAGIAHMLETQSFQQLVLSDQSLQKRQNDLRKTRDVLSSYDYRAKHESIRALRCTGTCSWLLDLEAVRTWMQDTTSKPFCCYGIPGAGKTILASAVIDAVVTTLLPASIQDPPTTVCYHYCDYAEDVTLDATRAVGSLARQLLDLSPLGIAAVAERCRKAVDTDFSATWQDIVFCLEQTLKAAGKILIVLDGVDEMNAANQDRLLTEIIQISGAANGRIKLMLFARRDERMIRRHLQDSPSITISAEENGEDLITYVETRLQTCINNGELLLRSDSIAQAIVDRLIVGAEHMYDRYYSQIHDYLLMSTRFLWARLQIEELCYAHTEAAIEEVLGNLPNSLSETYDRIVQRIERTPNGQAKLDLAARLLQWIICAARPLTTSELREAVAIKIEDKRLQRDRIITDDTHIFEACSNLIMRGSDGTVRLAHHTVQEYVISEHYRLSNRPTGFERLRTTSSYHAARFTAEACLAYICFEDFSTQIVTSHHRNVYVPTSHAASSSAFLTRAVGRSKLASLLDMHTPLRRKSRPIHLILPERSDRTSEQAHTYFAMLDYIKSYWHWHVHQWHSHAISANFEGVAIFDPTEERLQQVLWSIDTSFVFRPWLTSQGSMVDHSISACWQDLLAWAIESDYISFLEILQEPRIDADGFDRRLGNFRSFYILNRVTPQPLLLACRAGSMATASWILNYASYMVDASYTVENDHIDMLELMGLVDPKTYSEFLKLRHIFPAEPSITGQGYYSNLMAGHDLPKLENFVTNWVANCHEAELADSVVNLQMLCQAVETNDASIVGSVVRAVLAIGLPSAYDLQEDWREALKICVDGCKTHCLLELHALHKATCEAKEPGELTVLQRYIGETRAESGSWLFGIYKDHEELVRYFKR